MFSHRTFSGGASTAAEFMEEQGLFPEALCTGFAHPLPKKDDSVLVNDFRPVIIFSMIYRSWSSLRARQYLGTLKTLTGNHQFGFLPQRENTEIWMVLQGWIEQSLISHQDIAGYVADIEKAFECLPREPLLWLANGHVKACRGIMELFSGAHGTSIFSIQSGRTRIAINFRLCRRLCNELHRNGHHQYHFPQVHNGLFPCDFTVVC